MMEIAMLERRYFAIRFILVYEISFRTPAAKNKRGCNKMYIPCLNKKDQLYLLLICII
jgi:hypothetical protein